MLEINAVTVLGHYKDTWWGLKDIEASDNILVFMVFEDVYLCFDEFIDFFIWIKIGFRDDFDGNFFKSVLIESQIDFRGGSLSQKLPKKIPLHTCL